MGESVTLEKFLDSLGAARELAELEARDRRDCDCPIPYTLRKYYPHLGAWTNIKLCCAIRALEKLIGQTLYEAYDFEPTEAWDCDEVAPLPDGSEGRKGMPPPWLYKRMQQKGIRVRNDDGTQSDRR